ncbi:AraC-like DNA-binding protein [Anseongella ginsenosidimutans]|uniref:AraC-like DNA-binding protein n=1 Tax=Anseongella ginsenosidimutans TaxID=496056 RepID=A0A4R3KRZ5_9SPHI|nr:AraC family transcriptional regulator [Anseongella ginsenosidimutans]QEC52897.1 helix-turn-helix transcriptional regulator [Anseongella ginsenosidimutans]TCS87287.1 AraC-like DNA-binding protein [Anseongella ginsenosidimutans]
MENGQTTTFVMHYGDLNLEIFPAGSPTAVPVDSRIIEDQKSEYMVLAMDEYGALHFRVTELANCSIWHTRFYIEKRIKLRVTADKLCTFLWVAWKNTLRYSINKAPEQQIIGDYYNLCHLPNIEWEINFRKPGEHETFNVLFTNPEMDEWKNMYNSTALTVFLDNIQKGKLTFLNPFHRRLTTEMRHIVSDLIRGPVTPVNRRDYYENKVTDLIFQVLRDMIKSETAPDKFSGSNTLLNPLEIERIYQIRDTIIKHPENAYSLNELKQTAGMNKTKLEAGFKQLFGTTVFGLIQEQRMQMALSLLQKNYSVKEVAAKTGYKNSSNFTQAFTRYFGYPPSRAARE